jgi:hypothetical protein
VARTRSILDGKRGPKDPAAIHRKGRDHVEDGQKQVDRREPCNEPLARIVDRAKGRKAVAGAEKKRQAGPDDDVHRGTGKGDCDLLRRGFGYLLEPRHTANRQERDVRGAHTEAARHEGMTELMGDHAGKERHTKATLTIAAMGPPDAKAAVPIHASKSRNVA